MKSRQQMIAEKMLREKKEKDAQIRRKLLDRLSDMYLAGQYTIMTPAGKSIKVLNLIDHLLLNQ